MRRALVALVFAACGCASAPTSTPASQPASDAFSGGPGPRSGGSREPAREARRGGVGITAGLAGRGEGAEPPRGIDPSAPLVEVRSLDPTIRVELRYATADNFTGAPLPGYVGRRALLRPAAARALARAQAALRAAGLGLLVYDAYRPVRASQAMAEWARRTGHLDLIRDGYLAVRSRHNLGLAVDLTLCDLATGRPLAMGTAYDAFTTRAHTANAAGPALANRRRLAAAMSAAGFAPYAQEWWHFSWESDGSTERYDVDVP